MAIKKVIINNNVELDLTTDTVSEQYVQKGKTFHDSEGASRTGTKIDIDLSQDTVAEQYVSKGKTFHDSTGTKKTGTKEDIDLSNDTVSEQYVTQGKTFHNAWGVQKTGTKIDIDLSNDTVSEQYVTQGKTFHNSLGQLKTGTKVDIDLSNDTVSEQYVAQGKTFHNSLGQLKTGTATFESGTLQDLLNIEGDADKIYYNQYNGSNMWTAADGNFVMIRNNNGVTHSEFTNPSSSKLALYNFNSITASKLLTILNELELSNSIIPVNKNLKYNRDDCTWSWVDQNSQSGSTDSGNTGGESGDNTGGNTSTQQNGSATFSGYYDDNWDWIEETNATTLFWDDLKNTDNANKYKYNKDLITDNAILYDQDNNLCAFQNCQSLVSIIIPNNITSIGTRAFCGCTNLTSIEIPTSVTSIGPAAFGDCSSLTSVTIPNGITNLNNTFNGCQSLTSITIPNSVTNLGENTFRGCYNLTSITIPNSITSIDYGVFYECVSLTSITIPNSVTNIGAEAFNYCESLTSITFLGTKAEWNAITKGSDWDNNTENYTIHCTDGCLDKDGNVTNCSIHGTGQDEENNSQQTGSATFSDGTTLSWDELKEATNGTNYNYDTSALSDTSIGYSAFYGCTNLTSITIPDGVTEINDDAFYGCANLISIVFPSSLRYIYNRAFFSCTSLTSVTIPNGVIGLGEEIFNDCTNLTTVNLPATIAWMAWGIFAYCTSLQSIEVPYGITNMGYEQAFNNCTSLTSITLPASITSIGDLEFNDCTSLTSIVFQGTKAQWDAIEKGSDWDNNTGSYTIHCTDSCLNKEGNVTNCSIHGTRFSLAECVYDSEEHGSVFYYSLPDNIEFELNNPITITYNNSDYSATISSNNDAPSVELSSTLPWFQIQLNTYPGGQPGNPGGFTVLYSGDTSWSNFDKAQIIFKQFINNTNNSGDSDNSGDSTVPGATFNDGTTLSWDELKDTTNGSNYGYNNSAISDTIIDDEAFYDCDTLISIIIPTGVISIEEYAFFGCTSLTSITIPDSVTSIGIEAFRDCESLTSITIPNSVTSIGEGGFGSCSILTSITIPNSVTSIGDATFYDCTSLTSITFQGTKTQWDEIEKGSDWNQSTGNYTVHCTDGDISK